MLVSHHHQFIYVKTFKSASTSTEVALERFCRPKLTAADAVQPGAYDGPTGIVAPRGYRDPTSPFHAHMTAKAIKNELGRRIWSRYAKVCTVRNPYAKAVSWFWHQVQKGKIHLPNVDRETAIETFRHRLQVRPNLPRDDLRHHINGRRCIDYPLRVEQLEWDLAAFCTDLGVTKPQLPSKKSGFHKVDLPFQRYYDAETAQIVANHYSLDFRSFGYDIESWQVRPLTKDILPRTNTCAAALSA